MEKNQEKTWDQNYVTDRKRWTRFVKTTSQTGNGGLGLYGPETVESVCQNYVTDRKRWTRFVKTTSQTGNGGLGLYGPETVESVCQNYVTDRKRWTLFVRSFDKPSPLFPVRDIVLIPGLLPIYLQDEILKWPRDEASKFVAGTNLASVHLSAG